MRHDLHSTFDVKLLFPPIAAVVDNTPQVSNIIDLANSTGCELVFLTGTLSDADATFTVLLEEGDAANLSDAAVPQAAAVLGSAALASFTFASDNKVFKLGYYGTKRYIRATVTPAANTGNLFLAGVAILQAKSGPTPNPPV